MKTRVLLLLLLTVSTLILFVGCGTGDSGTTPAVTTAETTGATTTATTAATTTAAVASGFNYKGDLTPYLTIARDMYFGVTVKIPAVEEVTDEALEDFINTNLLLGHATPIAKESGLLARYDLAVIYYRGQVEVDGEWVDFIGGSNLHDAAYELMLGSGSFIPGFEDALIGRDVAGGKQTLLSEAGKTVGVDGLPIVYISCSCSYTDEKGVMRSGVFADRIDLTKAGDAYAVRGRYDESTLRDDLLGATIGEELEGTYVEHFDITGDLVAEEVTITKVKVTAIVETEDPFVFTVSFPESYSANTALEGKSARWYVILTEAKTPQMPEVTADFIRTKLGITADMMTPLLPDDEGMSDDEKLEAAFPLYVRAYLERNRENTIYQTSMAEYWSMLLSGVTIKQYPEGLVESHYEELMLEVETTYENFLAAYGTTYYPTLADFIPYYFGNLYVPAEGESAEDAVYRIAEGEIRQNLILYYIGAEEGLLLSDEEEDEFYREKVQELLDYYNDYYDLAGTGGELTEEDLATAGYTREAILKDDLYQRFCAAMYEAYYDHIEFLD